jgi:hypothetical protein
MKHSVYVIVEFGDWAHCTSGCHCFSLAGLNDAQTTARYITEGTEK